MSPYTLDVRVVYKTGGLKGLKGQRERKRKRVAKYQGIFKLWTKLFRRHQLRSYRYVMCDHDDIKVNFVPIERGDPVIFGAFKSVRVNAACSKL